MDVKSKKFVTNGLGLLRFPLCSPALCGLATARLYLRKSSAFPKCLLPPISVEGAWIFLYSDHTASPSAHTESPLQGAVCLLFTVKALRCRALSKRGKGVWGLITMCWLRNKNCSHFVFSWRQSRPHCSNSSYSPNGVWLLAPRPRSVRLDGKLTKWWKREEDVVL